MPNLQSYGYLSHENIANDRVADGNVAVMAAALAASVAEHNRVVNAALGELVERTTEYSRRYKVGGGGTLQPLDQWGNPLPVKDAGYYDVAFPIQGGGTAWGDNRISRALMTIADADRYTFAALRRDADWIKRHILGAMFDNTSYTYTDPDHGSLTVVPLANGDGALYLRKNGTSSVDTHYYAQAAAIADGTNPFPTLHAELAEHVENSGPYVAYIPTALKATTMALTAFHDVADPNLQQGSGLTQLVGSLDRGMGDTVLGYVDPGIWIVEMEMLPATHGLVVARGTTTPALAMREYPAAGLRGLFAENHSPDGNLNEYRMIRYAGFGGLNRTAAVAFYIGGGAYTIPTGYETPMAV